MDQGQRCQAACYAVPIDSLALRRQYILDDRHKKRRLRLSIERRDDDTSKSVQLRLIVCLLEDGPQLRRREVELRRVLKGRDRRIGRRVHDDWRRDAQSLEDAGRFVGEGRC